MQASYDRVVGAGSTWVDATLGAQLEAIAAVAGTRCSDPYTVARTRWNSVIGCSQYYTSSGRMAAHWSCLKYNPATDEYCTSDGYLYAGMAGPTYRPSVCNQPAVSPRLAYTTSI